MPDPRDEFEPADDEPGDAEGSAESGVMTAEERTTLKAVQDAGLPVAELTARARRDLQTEQAQAAAGTPAPAGEGQGDADPERVITAGEAQRLMEKAATDARNVTVQTLTQTRLEGVVNRAIAETPGFGEDVPPGEIQGIQRAVGEDLMKNVNFQRLSPTELDREVLRLTREALEAKRKFSDRVSGASRAKEAQSRVAAQAESAPAGMSGSSGKRSAPETTPRGAPGSAYDYDNPRYGVTAGAYPTPAEMDEHRDAGIERFDKELAAGR